MKTSYNKFLLILVLLFSGNLSLFATTYTWNGGTGDWNTASNWNPVGVPGNGDIAIISSANVTLTSDVTVAGLQLVVSNLHGDFALTVTDTMDWNGSGLRGNGALNISPGASVKIIGSTQLVCEWTLVNNGVIRWFSGSPMFLNGVTFTNNGLFIVGVASDYWKISGRVYNSRIDNYGTFRKSGSAATLLDIDFHNYDSLQVQNGMLTNGGAISNSGNIDVSAGATWQPGNGTVDGSVIGAGTISIFGTNTIFGGIYDITGQTTISVATVTFDTNATVNNFGARKMTVYGLLTLNTGNQITIDSLFVSNGRIEGSDFVAISHWMKVINISSFWNTGGWMISTIAELYLSSSTQQDFHTDIENNGMIYWQSGHIYLWDGAAINNDGTFRDEQPGSYFEIRGYGAGGFFNNYGHYEKLGPATTDIYVPFDNYDALSSVQIFTGVLRLLGGGVSNGAIDVSTQLVFGGNSWDIRQLSGNGLVDFQATAASVTGSYFNFGQTRFLGGVTTFQPGANIYDLGLADNRVLNSRVFFNTGDTVRVDSLNISGGIVNGSDPLLINRSLIVNDGQILGSGTLETGMMTRTFFGGQSQTVGRDFTNNGVLIWQGGNFTFVDSAVFDNYGVFEDQINNDYWGVTHNSSPSSGINNAGQYRKTGTVRSDFSVQFNNLDTGRIEGIGWLRFLVTFSNWGTVSPGDSVGSLMIGTNYPTEVSSLLDIEIAGPPASGMYDRLEVPGNAVLGGELRVSLLDGFVPIGGDIYPIMTYTTHTDSFATINLPFMSSCKYFSVEYTDSSVNLLVSDVTGNLPPLANADSAATVSDSSIAINVLLNDSDPENDTLTVYSVSSPVNGVAVISGDSSIIYTPAHAFVGSDSFLYTLRDRPGCLSSAMVTVQVDSILVGLAGEEGPVIPAVYVLHQNYPNPFNPAATIRFDLPQRSPVKLVVYDILGREVAVLVDEFLPAGKHRAMFDGASLGSGIYFYRITAGSFSRVKRMMLVR